MQEQQNGRGCCPQQMSSTQCQQHGLAYALYYQLETLTNSGVNSSIDITQVAAESKGDFSSDGNQVQILNPGVYQITYIVNIPTEETLVTTFALQVNRQNVAGTERFIAKPGTSEPVTAIAQIIITVCRPVTIRVVSSAELDITGEECEVLASLFIQQLA